MNNEKNSRYNRRAVLRGTGLVLGSAAVGGLMARSPTVHAQDAAAGYPNRPIRWVVPYAPGGITDTLARVCGERLNEAWSQPVLVENRPGGASNIGNEAVARSAPDGYTLLLASPPLSINPALMPDQMRYDPERDLAPVIHLVNIPNAVFVPANSPFRTLKDLIDHARANPDRLTYGTSGIGTINHLGGELLRVKADIKISVVPFKGSAPLAQDLVAGNIPMAVDNLSTHAGLLQAGKLRALAVLQAGRVPTSPDIPATGELGLPEVSAVGWSGVSVRAGTPQAIIDRLARELDRICKLPQVRARFESGGSQLVGGTPADFARHMQTEARKWQGLIRDLGIKAG